MDIIEKISRGLRELALFAGAGGGILGGKMLGWRTVCAVEIEPYCQSVLCQRQNDGILAPFPIWDDVCSFDGTAWRGYVDVVSGGFPCQDISAANQRGEGITGERSGLWKQMWRIIREVQPRFAFMENSPFITARGLDTVLGDLAEIGYDAEWCVLGASDIGANHERERMWILARKVSDSGQPRCEQSGCNCGIKFEMGQSKPRNNGYFFSETDRKIPDTDSTQYKRMCSTFGVEIKRDISCSYGEVISKTQPEPRREIDPNRTGEDVESWTDWTRYFITDTLADAKETQKFRIYNTEGNERGSFGNWWKTEPGIFRVVDGMANRVDRLRSVGNGQVPAVAAAAFILLLRRLFQREKERN